MIGGRNASGYLNDVWYSSDGVNWTQVTVSTAFPARTEYACVVHNNAMWVIGGAAIENFMMALKNEFGMPSKYWAQQILPQSFKTSPASNSLADNRR